MPSTTKKSTAVAKKPPAKKKAAESVKAVESVKEIEKIQESTLIPAESPVKEHVPKKRKGHTRDSVIALLDELLSSAEEEIASLRSGEKPKGLGVKYMRGMVKRIRITKSAASKVMKTRNAPKREANKSSGFLKPVILSNEMAEFTGWDKEELRSRVDVTKYLCKYIKDHNLQNTDDRRIIIPDTSLSSLLSWSSDATDDLTYYRMQTQMKRHFSNPV